MNKAADTASAAAAMAAVAAWDDYFVVLDSALNAGPQGKPWSADAVDLGAKLYRASKGATILAH
jgi:hypothetical protein